jgi:hypothetical protein
MRTLSISPSLLEEYRLTLLGMWDKNGDTLEAYITQPRVDSEAMSRGRAYHLLLEHGPERYAYWTGKDYSKPPEFYGIVEPEMNKAWEFSPAAVAPIIALREKYKGMVHEVWAHWETEIQGTQIRMNMRFDAIDGLDYHEFKTTGSQPNYLKYFDSIQWRCYLLPFPEIQSVNYTVFQLSSGNDRCTPHFYRMAREEGNEDTVLALLSSFVAWLETRPACWAVLESKALKTANRGLVSE